MNDMAIETRGLHKRFGKKTAVADLTLAVPRGEVFGFLGPNGAGKSTSVKMLLGLARPSGGSASVLGLRPGTPEAAAQIGFLPEHFRFQEWMHAAEFLDLHGSLAGLGASERRRRVGETLELVGLSDQAARPLSGFSKGMLQRIGLAQAIIHQPKLVFLDEPTSALDPFGRMLVRQIIGGLRERGTTVFLNSHLLGEVEATCDRVAFIRGGQVLRTEGMRALTAGRIQVTLRVDVLTEPLRAALGRMADILTPLITREAAASDRPDDPVTVEFDVASEAALPEIASAAIAAGARLYALAPHRRSLEDIFLEIVGRQDSGQ